MLKRNEGIIEVYKKKFEQMAELRADLTDALELNQKLYADIEMMSKDQESEQKMQ